MARHRPAFEPAVLAATLAAMSGSGSAWSASAPNQWVGQPAMMQGSCYSAIEPNGSLVLAAVRNLAGPVGEDVTAIDGSEMAGTGDLTPTPFTFRTRGRAEGGVNYPSPTVTIAGLSQAAPVAISGDQSAVWSRNGGPFTAAPGEIANGDLLQLRLVARPAGRSENTMTVTVGTYETTYTVRTAVDATPDLVFFPERPAEPPGRSVQSTQLEPAGFNVPLRASVEGDPSCRMRVNGAADLRRRATLEPGDRVRLRVVTAPLADHTVVCIFALGDITAHWFVTTGP